MGGDWGGERCLLCWYLSADLGVCVSSHQGRLRGEVRVWCVSLVLVFVCVCFSILRWEGVSCDQGRL